MRVRVYAGAMLVVWVAAIGVVQLGAQGQKVTTPEQLDKVMKTVGPSMQKINKEIGSAAFDDAKKELATMRAAVLDSQSFWIEHKKDDAVNMNKDTLAKIDAFDKLLSASPVDAAAAGVAMKDVGRSCSACHKQYRAQDADNNYILKPGTIGG
jgi:cytochrome c556